MTNTDNFLRITASCLGPVQALDAQLSGSGRNMIYARNGTGKSFLTRALRYLDRHAQGLDVSDAAGSLVSEESTSGLGDFSIGQGQKNFGTLNLNVRTPSVHATAGDKVFHVFSEEFVHTELRQNNFVVDGNINDEIRLDHTNIDTKEVEGRLESKDKEAGKHRVLLHDVLERKKAEDLVTKAGVNKRLKDFSDIAVGDIIQTASQPSLPERSFKSILSDLDALKSIPAEPAYPSMQNPFSLDRSHVDEIDGYLSKITSPSTISEEVKSRVETNPAFFESGLKILGHDEKGECPFCQQSVEHPPAKDLIELYMAYFADAEGKHKAELRGAWVEIKSYRAGITDRIGSIGRETLKFEALRKFLPSQKAVVLPDFTEVSTKLDEAMAAYVEAIQAKGTAPGTEVGMPSVNIEALVLKLNEQIAELNATFGRLNKAISQTDQERKSLQREACQAFVVEFAHAHWSEIQVIKALNADAQTIRAELAELKKSELSGNVKERVAQTFELLISSFFGSKYSFDKNEFVLHRDNKKMTRGPNRTLSDGEKTAIAFCYFIASVHRKVKTTSKYKDVFLVFDDPITSMSYDFVFSIAQTLKNLSISNNGQISINPSDADATAKPELLVLTHSSYFYNICVTNKVIGKKSAFFLFRSGGEHKIANRARYVSPFEEHLKEIVEVHNGREPNHMTGNAVRCVLEAIGRFCHPDKSDSLSDFIKFLAGEERFEIKSVLINSLSHGTYYDESPSPEELQEACGEAIVIVERYARGQLELVRLMSTAEALAA